MIVGMVDDRAMRFRQQGTSSAPGRSQTAGPRPTTPPRLSAINRRLTPSGSGSSPSMRVRDPNERPNPVTSFLGGLFEPRVPTPKWVETNQPGAFSNRGALQPIDSKVGSMFHRPLPPPPLTPQDEMATSSAPWGMPVMRDGKETMLYNNITRDDWGRLVVAPGFRDTRDPRLPTYSGNEPTFTPYQPSQEEIDRWRRGQRERYGGNEDEGYRSILG